MHLIDGAETPGGLSSGWRNAAGQTVEAGIKGFWFQASLLLQLRAAISGSRQLICARSTPRPAWRICVPSSWPTYQARCSWPRLRSAHGVT